jgi:hypothetical protein
METLAWIEQTGLAVFVREDVHARSVPLIVHARGTAFPLGGGMAIARSAGRRCRAGAQAGPAA